MLLTVTPERPGAGSATSFWLAERLHTNPVVIRRISGQLARAGLLRVRRGAGGAVLARQPESITLEDVWLAVGGPDPRPLLALPALDGADREGVRMRSVLAGAFVEAEVAFRGGLRGITLRDLAMRLTAD